MIYIVKSFDLSTWCLNHYVIAFKTKKEAEDYCEFHNTEHKSFFISYSWEEVYIGKFFTKK
jgi:hypothetical protein